MGSVPSLLARRVDHLHLLDYFGQIFPLFFHASLPVELALGQVIGVDLHGSLKV